MRRNLTQMAGKTYDVIVIGGGITGACVAWDAQLRGLKVALLEKQDFSHATSSATSKLIHGGLRYLKNMEFGLVRESLRERRIMEVIAPHLVHPLPFIVPTYGLGMRGKWVLMAALWLYDLLAYDRKRLDDPDKQIPGFRTLNRQQVLEMMPGIHQDNLTGGAIYYDCQMYSPDRLTLEFVLSAAEYGADVANYAEVIGFLQEGAQVRGVKVRDALNGETHTIQASLVVNAAGPWADLLLGLLQGQAHKSLIRSKGIHLITKKLVPQALVLQTPAGRHFFIIPWREHSLIGTTDKLYEGHPDQFQVTETDIAEFIQEINAGFPGARLQRQDVLAFYGGLRPIVDDQTENKGEIYKASRKYEIYDHAQEGLNGLMSIVGGKYTTSRHLAETLVDQIFRKLSRPSPPCLTASTPLFGGELGRYSSFVFRTQQKFSQFAPEVVAHLCRNYGSRAPEVLKWAVNDERFARPLSETLPDIAAQVAHAVDEEMACTLEDVVFRRTGLATLGNPGLPTLGKITEWMSKSFGWDEAEKDRQIQQVLAHFTPLLPA